MSLREDVASFKGGTFRTSVMENMGQENCTCKSLQANVTMIQVNVDDLRYHMVSNISALRNVTDELNDARIREMERVMSALSRTSGGLFLLNGSLSDLQEQVITLLANVKANFTELKGVLTSMESQFEADKQRILANLEANITTITNLYVATSANLSNQTFRLLNNLQARYELDLARLEGVVESLSKNHTRDVQQSVTNFNQLSFHLQETCRNLSALQQEHRSDTTLSMTDTTLSMTAITQVRSNCENRAQELRMDLQLLNVTISQLGTTVDGVQRSLSMLGSNSASNFSILSADINAQVVALQHLAIMVSRNISQLVDANIEALNRVIALEHSSETNYSRLEGIVMQLQNTQFRDNMLLIEASNTNITLLNNSVQSTLSMLREISEAIIPGLTLLLESSR